MGQVGASFNGNIFSYDQPLIIAMNRQSAVLGGVRLRYQSGGYLSGTVLARNSIDGLYEAYDSGGSSGTDTAAAILYEGHTEADFDGTAATSSTVATGIFGGCAVYKDKMIGYDSSVLTDLNARLIVVNYDVELMSF